MAAPPGQCIALQAINMVKEAISGYVNPFQKSQDDSSECASSTLLLVLYRLNDFLIKF